VKRDRNAKKRKAVVLSGRVITHSAVAFIKNNGLVEG
jgi:hypothetical protein